MRIVFDPFVVDVDSRRLTAPDRVPHLSRKAFDLLVTLALARPSVLTKAELQQRLWPATFVDEANLANLIAEIRGALDDDPRQPSFIRTVHRVGYAFCAQAQTLHGTATLEPGRPACWLECGSRRISLDVGEHEIGRDADVSVSLDDSTVSRRHARLIVRSDGAVLHDLSSKNGTFHNGSRVDAAVAVKNGDSLGFGSLVVFFRVAAPNVSTETRSTAVSS
jgi:DNA-binding winged helix-turn-helix (wHTH) protein